MASDTETHRKRAREQRSILGILGAVVLGVTACIAFLGLPGAVCLSRTWLHLPCPACGLTRSLCACWHGEILLSFRYHPLGFPLFLLCLGLVGDALRRSSATPLAARLLAPRTVHGILAAGVVLWLLRLVLSAANNSFFLW